MFDSTLCTPDFPARIIRALTYIPDTTVRRHAESAADKAYGLLPSRPHQDFLSMFDEVKDAVGGPSCETQSPDARGGPAPQVPPSSSAGPSVEGSGPTSPLPMGLQLEVGPRHKRASGDGVLPDGEVGPLPPADGPADEL